ncbi:Propanediol utilization protein [Geosporobacter subterraneus DSM 17957]|uniref:Phosphate propanoyltransferase n=1 Tax=Geosporobacter subterraneus DSM 17957 TaxID=1121919 RepID=A0A1M6JS09_9FIRM|nr:phosphate propanoyltransferase [Geosporobacter subterraneus]SHJ49517.1 Propanediol utilization protein [Geosporobacter subterraneus DSM 17957]
MDERKMRMIIEKVIEKMEEQSSIPVEASGRHVHLSKEHVRQLFGDDRHLSIKKELSQPKQVQYNQRVTLIGPKGIIQGVTLLGPARGNTQIELTKTDALKLGIDPPVRESGDLQGSASLWIAGERGVVLAEESTILAKRHIHMEPADAQRLQVEDRQKVAVRIMTNRPVIFEDVTVRVHENYRLSMHIDYDEANACNYVPGTRGKIISID